MKPLALLLLIAASAVAHHGYAAFDTSAELTSANHLAPKGWTEASVQPGDARSPATARRLANGQELKVDTKQLNRGARTRACRVPTRGDAELPRERRRSDESERGTRGRVRHA